MFIIKEGTAADKVGEGTTTETLASIQRFLEKQGLTIRTAEQEKTFLDSQKQEAINQVISERNRQMEDTILETTGINKNQGEKFHEYHKRAIIEKTKEASDLKTKIADLERQGLSGSTLAQQYKQEVETIRQQLQTVNTEWQKKFEDKTKEVFTSKASGEMEKTLAILKGKIDPTIKPELIDDIIQARLAKFKGDYNAADLDGLIVYKDKEGKTKLSKKDGKPETFEEIFSTYLGELIDTKRQQQGAGSGSQGQGAAGQGNQGGQAGAKWKDYQRPDTIKSKMQLTDYLRDELKLDASTKDWSEAFDSLGKDLPLTEKK